MGCGGSKEQTVDFSNVDAAAKKKKDGANKSASPSDKKNARPTGRIGQSSTFNLLPDLVPFTSNTRISELPIISPDAALQRFLSAPTMTDAVRTTTASTNKAVKTGAHHLKNIFAKPLDDTDISSFKAAVFAKDGKEKEFIREAVKNNFVFAALSERELRTLVDAFEKIQVKQDEVIIKQGDPGDYFYVIRDGKVKFNIAGQTVGETSEGSFGELALLYTCPRAATVIAETKTVLYRVDQKTFRYILQSQTLQTDNDTRELLKKVPFLAELDPTDLNKLVYAMSPLSFEAGEYLLRKGEIGDVLYVIQEGDVKVTNITVGSTDYEDQELGPGSYFGERAWVKLEPRPANCIAKTKVVALTIDKETFEKVVGDVSMLTLKSEDKRKLGAIKVIQDTLLAENTLATLAAQIADQTFAPRTPIFEEGKKTKAALYFVRSGKVELKSSSGRHQIIDDGGYFGDDLLTIDVGGLQQTDQIEAQYNVTTLGEDVVVGLLKIEDLRKYIDTTSIGQGKRLRGHDSMAGIDIPLDSLEKHAILGAGTFGQVWLVSYNEGGKKRPYALKIQSKYELVKNHQAKGVVQEKKIMAKLHHPFIINLVQSYQDKQNVFMLLGIVQGGELFSLLHTSTRDGMPEIDARFYAAGIIEGLSYMHRRDFVYRDLKPENVLIDAQGYPVIVDMGFAKHVPSKTYTLCGTPLYLAPEVILNRGHDKGADHWSFAVLLYEMIAGYTPFYTEGMDQITLFKSVCRGEYQFPPGELMSIEVEDLIQRFFVVDPAKRLGSLARGINEIFAHLWFDQIDFNNLRHKEITAPWVPTLKDPLDRTNFDNWDHLEDKTEKQDPPISERHEKIFEDF